MLVVGEKTENNLIWRNQRLYLSGFGDLKEKNMRQRNNGMNGHSLDLEPLHGHRPTDNKIVKLLYSSSKY